MIKFNRYNVTNGKIKARIHYSLDNRCDGRKCVTLYAKDYDRRLGEIFTDTYKNDSDLQTDYFDKGRVNLFETHPLYRQARAKAESIIKQKEEQNNAYITRNNLYNLDYLFMA